MRQSMNMNSIQKLFQSRKLFNSKVPCTKVFEEKSCLNVKKLG